MHMWVDVSAGVAGDMLLGALIDAGAESTAIQRAIDVVVPDTIELQVSTTTRGGQRALHVTPRLVAEDQPHRSWATIRSLLGDAALAPETKESALGVFELIAKAEAHVHGVDIDQVHFHEVGAWDSIADIVGVCEAIRLLGVGSISASTLAVGAGSVKTAHGIMPVPVPAVAELSVGWPLGGVRFDEAPGELTTPTGVALIRYFAKQWQQTPQGRVFSIGVGAGTKETVGWPNIVRVLLGEKSRTIGVNQDTGQLIQLESNIDDLDPRLWPGVLDALLETGARDAWLTPIIMKKGRPAMTVHVLADESIADACEEVLFRTTTTLGVRRWPVHRTGLDREMETRTVLGKTVRVKVGYIDGEAVKIQPEFVDVQAIADELGLSEAEVLAQIKR